MLEPPRSAAVPAMYPVRPPTHSARVPMVRSPAAVRSRGAFGLLGPERERRRDRARAQVRGLAPRVRRDGGAHGAPRVASRRDGGAHRPRARSARPSPAPRARIQPERTDRARARQAMAHPGMDRLALTAPQHRDPDTPHAE